MTHRHTPRRNAGRAPREVGRLPFHQLTSHDQGAHSHDCQKVLRRKHQIAPQSDFVSAWGCAAGIQPELRSTGHCDPTRSDSSGTAQPSPGTAARGADRARTSVAVRPQTLARYNSPAVIDDSSICVIGMRRRAACKQRGMSGSLPYGLRLVGGGGLEAQNFPLNVRPQLLTGNPPGCQPLDLRAVLGWRAPASILPLRDGSASHPECARECSLGAKDFGRDVDGVLCHDRKYRFSVLGESRQSVPVWKDNLYAAQMELKKWVRAARKAKGWTQTQLGDAISLTKQNISGWENGRHEPSFSQMVKIVEVTGFAMPGDVSAPAVLPPSEPYLEQLTLSPAERDLVLAIRKLPMKEQDETTRDVMHRAEVLDELVQRAMAEHGISISGYATASRAAEMLPAPPSIIPARAPGDPDATKTPLTHNRRTEDRREKKS